MAARLPTLYREGELVHAVLTQPAVQLEIVDEYAREVQRAHFFDDGLDLEEAARLAALLDFAPEPWQNLRLFRAWVHVQRNATLQNGAVSRAALEQFAREFAAAYVRATGHRFSNASPQLIENPWRRRYAAAPVDGMTPLTRFSVEMKGLDAVRPSFVVVGLAAGPESVPLIANLTTGEAIVFLGEVPVGQRLWLRPTADGSLTARLERADVSTRLRSITGLVPGTPWAPPQIQSPAQALRLVRGTNELWFLPVAHFEERGLDRFLLALADLAFAQGRWDEGKFDHALFFQDAAVQLKMTWLEAEPASIELHLPLQAVERRPTAKAAAADVREEVTGAVASGIAHLKAAGVRSEVHARSFCEIQGQGEFLTAVLPLRVREAGSSGADRLPNAGGVFDVTGFQQSTFR
jgi:hypothetical protein